MNNKKYNLDCEIVRDLLPVYHDNVVSEKTKECVGEHLKECDGCKKEYDSLCKDFFVTEKDTAEAFAGFMKKKRLKQKLTVILAVLLSCLVMAGGYYTLTGVNLKPMTDVTVKKVFRYDGKQGQMFMVIYNHKNMSSSSPTTKFTEKDGKKIYHFARKIPVISKENNKEFIETECFSSEGCDELYFCGQKIWSEEENGDDVIPGYVYAYDEFENGNNDEFGDSDSISVSMGDGKISVHYDYEQRVVCWDLDGNLIYDTAESEE